MAVRQDPFGKVRGLIESMIDRLMKEAAKEADSKSFCDEETAKSKAKQEDLTAALDMHTVRIEKGEAGKARLSEQIKTLSSELAEMNGGEAEAEKVRQKEHADFLVASKEYKESAEAVANAIQVLSDYYSNGAFVQIKTKSGARQPDVDFGAAKTDIGSTIISMLEVAESDFTRLLAESEAEETSAASAYEKLTQDNKVSKASKQEESKGKQAEVKSLEVAISNYNQDHAGTSE